MPQWAQRCHQHGPEALIEIFRDYGLIPDDRGELPPLTPSEAALIRSCGYYARAGRVWRSPLLPDEHVRGYPLFEHLTDADWYVRSWGCGPFDWHPKRARLRPHPATPPPIDPLSKSDLRLIRSLSRAPGHCLDRRTLKRTYWRRGARFVDFAIDRLIASDHITDCGVRLYPFSESKLNALLEAQSKRRTPPATPPAVPTAPPHPAFNISMNRFTYL